MTIDFVSYEVTCEKMYDKLGETWIQCACVGCKKCPPLGNSIELRNQSIIFEFGVLYCTIRLLPLTS